MTDLEAVQLMLAAAAGVVPDGVELEVVASSCANCSRPIGEYGDGPAHCVMCRDDLGSQLDRLRARADDAAQDGNHTLVEMLNERIDELTVDKPRRGSFWIDTRDGSNWRLLRAGVELVQLQRPHRRGPRIDRRVTRQEFARRYKCVVP